MDQIKFVNDSLEGVWSALNTNFSWSILEYSVPHNNTLKQLTSKSHLKNRSTHFMSVFLFILMLSTFLLQILWETRIDEINENIDRKWVKTQPVFIKLTKESLEKGVKYVQS